MSSPGTSEAPDEQVPVPAAAAAVVAAEAAGSGDSDSSDSAPNEDRIDKIRRFFAHKLRFIESQEAERRVKVLDDLTADGVVEYILSGRCKNIVTLAGAGISTSAGIPDFRSPGSGLYHNLQKYNLPDPQSIFDIRYFLQNPKPFFMLAKELYQGSYKPTPSHYFIKLLHEKGLLLRHYTQNIDTLERLAGLPDEMLIEAHGSFHSSHCVVCKKEYDIDWKKHFAAGYEIPTCTECPNVIKPDIVLFGEKLPDRFHECLAEDFDKCDLLIIMGSSLEVQPFASLIERVPAWCPRVLINRELVGFDSKTASLLAAIAETIEIEQIPRLLGGLQFDSPSNIRDVSLLGNCDDVIHTLADSLGWGDELRQMIKTEHEMLDLSEATASTSALSVVDFQPPKAL